MVRRCPSLSSRGGWASRQTLRERERETGSSSPADGPGHKSNGLFFTKPWPEEKRPRQNSNGPHGRGGQRLGTQSR